jgi:cytochrome c oxidase subunit 4
MSEHIISSKLYIGIWAALMCLTVITASVAFIDLGPLNTVVALVIATLKALLVVLFFMHVKYASEKLTKTVIVAAVFWLLIMLFLSLADYSTRGSIHAGML